MPTERDQQIIDAYEAWNPEEGTVTGLVEELSISRQRLYDVLDRNGIVPKSRRRQSQTGLGNDDLLAEMAEMALGYLLGQLQEAREELQRYRDKYGPI